ncbi:AraC family transcriptional regulator [Ralstonia pickettii]|nr:AraC family transcriptional regulator [Ralstonia insidiosa]MBX3771670.1 AraC family transcriptional regulator [Ralstonia pickettii]NOZ16495.1 helix-turn-helix transcriptional regulator [Betaproteobacteria bacterium]MBA9868711.1 AraC family transcriptional regulator [Ralstonia insidiosa]MBA9912582.1 AraC family transcriptional regulator [Ralstonia insidiosa]
MMRDLSRVAPDGSLASCETPAMWKRRSISPSLSPVMVDHYIATGDVELLDMVTTGEIFTLYLTPRVKTEVRMEGRGWSTMHLRTPLAFVAPGFYFAGRISMPIEWVNIHFDPSWLAQSGLQTNGKAGDAALRYDLSDALLMQIVRSIHEDALAGMPLGPMYAEALGAAALRRMTYLESRPRPREYAHAPMMQKAVEYIQDKFRDELTLQMVANAVDYPGDLYSFIRSFKKAHGLTPHQYIIESRLQAARTLITSGQCDVTEAAFTCGFSTASHFSATFRKRWGVSPSELKPGPAILTRAEARESTDR